MAARSALSLGADAQVAGAAEDAVEPVAGKEVVASLIRRVVAAELKGSHPRALAAATIARVVTPDLLAAAMAGRAIPRRPTSGCGRGRSPSHWAAG